MDMNKICKGIGCILYTFVGGILPHYGFGYGWPLSKKIRQFCGKMMFDRCGSNVDIGRKCRLSSSISIGNNSGIGDYSFIQGQVSIGNDVMMAPHVAIIGSNHIFNRKDVPMNRQGKCNQPVKICDDVWIGYGSKILAGVTVNQGSIVAAGAVVTKDVPEYSVVGGVPAKVIKVR